MKVKDIAGIMDPWQDLIVRENESCQLEEPIFRREMGKETWTTPDDKCSEMEVVGIDASWNTIILYVNGKEND